MVLSIGVDQTVQQCATQINALDLTYQILSDMGGNVWHDFSTGYYPHNTVLECNMDVVYTNTGFDDYFTRQHVTNVLQSVTASNHRTHPDTENTTDPIIVTADFNFSEPFIAGYPSLNWKTSETPTYTEITMSTTRWSTYTAEIPAQPEDTDIDYYIEIQNSAACNRTLPFNAPNNFYTFYVGVDTISPVIEHEYIPIIADAFLPVTIRAAVSDNLGIDTVILEYQINGGVFHNIEMSGIDDYSVTLMESLNVGDIVQYKICATDGAQIPNITYHPTTGYHQLEIVDKIAACIIDLDGSANSGPTIANALTSLTGYAQYSDEIPDQLSAYHSVFLCLGTYGHGNHVLTSDEAAIFKSYLDDGGCLYMEGGDTWYYDPQTSVHPYFHVNATSDGAPDASNIVGLPGTFTEGFEFNYSPEEPFNNWIDHLAAETGAFLIMANTSPSYNTAVAYDEGSYKTIGSSVKIGGFQPIPGGSSIGEFVTEIMDFFEYELTTPTPTPTPECIHNGDVTLDGEVTASDAQLGFQIALGLYVPSYIEECAADCDNNGEVTAGDAQLIFQTALGSETCFD